MNKKKIDQLKKISPLVWNSYQHMYDVRKVSIDGRLNFLLLLVSFLPVISIALYTELKNPILLVPTIFQLIALFILLKIFFTDHPQVHWFELKQKLEDLDKNNFYVSLIATLKAIEYDTESYQIYMRKISKSSIFLIIFSIYNLILGVFFVYLESEKLIYVSILLTSLVILSIVYYYIYDQPKYNLEENKNKFEKEIEEWLKK